jgi:hypothetical protein
VSSIIHNLRNMAMDMNAELESQNDQIDRITLKVIYNIVNGKSRVYSTVPHTHFQQLNEF